MSPTDSIGTVCANIQTIILKNKNILKDCARTSTNPDVNLYGESEEHLMPV